MARTTYKLQKKHGISHYKFKRGERKLLTQLLKEDETIHGFCRGAFVGGRGLLLATNKRLILIDTRTMTNYVRTLNYNRISGVNHTVQRFETLLFMNVDQYRFVFKSYSKDALRKITAHIMYNVEPVKEAITDYSSILKVGELDQNSHAFVPRHRHGKFSILPQ